MYGARHLEQDGRDGEGHGEPDCRLPPGDAAAVLADQPGETEEGEDAQQRLKMLHCPAFVMAGLDTASRVYSTCGAQYWELGRARVPVPSIILRRRSMRGSSPGMTSAGEANDARSL